MNRDEILNVGIVGLGYWGPNLLRNFLQIPLCRVKWICDIDQDRVRKMQANFHVACGTTNIGEILLDPEVHAVVNALPVSLHYRVSAEILKAGKHCMVEKPLAMTSAEAVELIEMAESRSLTLMVGHTFEYNAAVMKVKEYIDSGEIGDIYYINCMRVNLGIIRHDVDALWTLAPHDISILLNWLGVEPEGVSVLGACYLQPDIADLVTADLIFPGNRHAQILASWLNPEKIRKICVVGSKRMIVYDDVSLDQKIRIYDKHVDFSEPAETGEFGDFQLQIRTGDLVIPRLDFVEPLRTECSHFLDCCRTGQKPLTDGRNGLRVVRVLEACSRSMRENGRYVRISEI